VEKDGPLDGRKYNENNKDSQMGQVTLINIKKEQSVYENICSPRHHIR